ncbi:MAG: DUF6465 family protein [Lachnospiraceae bacterium]|nr:DUF6465 family protein [Lachnospiraceae bacterium]
MAVAKKTTAKKAETKKAATTRCTSTVSIEMGEVSLTPAQIQNAVKKAVKEAGLKPATLNIYINTAEKAAYYTVDGVADDSYKVDLTTL